MDWGSVESAYERRWTLEDSASTEAANGAITIRTSTGTSATPISSQGATLALAPRPSPGEGGGGVVMPRRVPVGVSFPIAGDRLECGRPGVGGTKNG